MDSENLNRWLTLLANFGVVIGLAVLIYELRETQHRAETESTIRRLNMIHQRSADLALSEILPEIVVKARSKGVQSLTEVERVRLASWSTSGRIGMQGQYEEYLRGYLDQRTASRIVKDAVKLLPLWEELGYELGDSEFETAVSSEAER